MGCRRIRDCLAPSSHMTLPRACMQYSKLRDMHGQRAAQIKSQLRLGLRRAIIFPILLRPQMRQRLTDGWNALLLVALRCLWVGSFPQCSEIYATCTVCDNRLGRVVI